MTQSKGVTQTLVDYLILKDRISDNLREIKCDKAVREFDLADRIILEAVSQATSLIFALSDSAKDGLQVAKTLDKPLRDAMQEAVEVVSGNGEEVILPMVTWEQVTKAFYDPDNN